MIPSNRDRKDRPSHKELSKKLRETRSLVEAGKWLPAEPAKLKADFDELEAVFGIDTTLRKDQTTIFVAALDEITPNHYAGARPPKQSYEPATRGVELLAFRWTSGFFQDHEMYFKFCLVGTVEDRRAFMFSIHEHRPE